ncbi:MAG: aspartate aminotransferase family protein [Rhizobiales bacterium]|nr:aspartate aminotransferase family protein [Hyphomicrobiales bacterium]NRB15316.1 aspartate aminotransferase family protein [Hyphomicrobiales bacterium]
MTNHLMNTYMPTDFSFERGEGCYIFANNPKTGVEEKYLDFGAGVAVLSVGHSHPHLVAALNEQAQKLWHSSNWYKSTQQETLSKRLCDISFADKVFFTNSGAESNECAIKVARRYHYAQGNKHKVNIITFEGAFHGRTIGTIAAGGQAKYLEGFGPKAGGFTQVPFQDWDALIAAADENCAAIMLEPIQGEGGLRSFDPSFVVKLRTYCDENDILLIFDEIQTGIGRTGRLFAYEALGVEPDIMSLAKGLGGGFPMGACLATAQAASGMQPGIHGSTYGGNQLAMAVANAVLDIILAEGFLANVKKISGILGQKLLGLIDAHPTIFESLKGEGLLIGLKCKIVNMDLLAALYDQKMLAIPAGDNVMRLLPPLIATEDEVNLAIEKLDISATLLKIETTDGDI